VTAAERISLPADVYRLAWSTLSSDDLHTTSGVLVFGVQTPVGTHAAAAQTSPMAASRR
jgi:copper transport protein